MKKMVLALVLCLVALPGFTSSAGAANFSDWAVMIVAGDDHSHSGAHSNVFDNARKDLAKAFAGIGFNPNNMIQFSVDPDKDAQETDIDAIATGLWDLSNRAKSGCLIYYTSHGTPDGIILNGKQMDPNNWTTIVTNACGTRPAVIVMSACFSGQFVPKLANTNRMVLTAAARDRTSFGCGDNDHYTFFDGCFLQSLPNSASFPDLAFKTNDCVGQLEGQMGVDLPSQPQLSLGPTIASQLNWK